jgi:hypothetical protein
MQQEDTITEAVILERVVAPMVAGLSEDAARSLLEFKFDRETTRDIRKLLQKNNRGRISAPERLALERYIRVGQFLDLVHAKARLSLTKDGSS